MSDHDAAERETVLPGMDEHSNKNMAKVLHDNEPSMENSKLLTGANLEPDNSATQFGINDESASPNSGPGSSLEAIDVIQQNVCPATDEYGAVVAACTSDLASGYASHIDVCEESDTLVLQRLLPRDEKSGDAFMVIVGQPARPRVGLHVDNEKVFISLWIQPRMWRGRIVGSWTEQEHQQLLFGLALYGSQKLQTVRDLFVPSRSLEEVSRYMKEHLAPEEGGSMNGGIARSPCFHSGEYSAWQALTTRVVGQRNGVHQDGLKRHDIGLVASHSRARSPLNESAAPLESILTASSNESQQTNPEVASTKAGVATDGEMDVETDLDSHAIEAASGPGCAQGETSSPTAHQDSLDQAGSSVDESYSCVVNERAGATCQALVFGKYSSPISEPSTVSSHEGVIWPIVLRAPTPDAEAEAALMLSIVSSRTEDQPHSSQRACQFEAVNMERFAETCGHDVHTTSSLAVDPAQMIDPVAEMLHGFSIEELHQHLELHVALDAMKNESILSSEPGSSGHVAERSRAFQAACRRQTMMLSASARQQISRRARKRRAAVDEGERPGPRSRGQSKLNELDAPCAASSHLPIQNDFVFESSMQFAKDQGLGDTSSWSYSQRRVSGPRYLRREHPNRFGPSSASYLSPPVCFRLKLAYPDGVFPPPRVRLELPPSPSSNYDCVDELLERAQHTPAMSWTSSPSDDEQSDDGGVRGDAPPSTAQEVQHLQHEDMDGGDARVMGMGFNHDEPTNAQTETKAIFMQSMATFEAENSLRACHGDVARASTGAQPYEVPPKETEHHNLPCEVSEEETGHSLPCAHFERRMSPLSMPCDGKTERDMELSAVDDSVDHHADAHDDPAHTRNEHLKRGSMTEKRERQEDDQQMSKKRRRPLEDDDDADQNCIEEERADVHLSF